MCKGDNCSSRLIFATAQSPTEPIDFRLLTRVRQPVTRSKAGVQGKIADVFSGRSRHAESQNELKAFRVLLATARADHWQEQPFVLEYHLDGAKHRYTPDILIAWGTHREAVEIKEDHEADLPENLTRFALFHALMADHGYYFRVWRRSEICAEPRLANVGLLLRYRCVNVSLMERETIRRAFSLTPEMPLHVFDQNHAVPTQSVLRLVLDGILHINWWEPVTQDSRVSIGPIGPQVWPCPPQQARSHSPAQGDHDGTTRISKRAAPQD